MAIVGARPQFIKHSAFVKAASGKLEVQTCYSGQHQSSEMSLDFLAEFNMPSPDYSLNLQSTSRAERSKEMEKGITEVLQRENPVWVLVYGDTDTTLAGARAAAALDIPLAHVEAGVRSFNADMPEEYNRIATDKLSALHFCPNEQAAENLSNEGHTTSIEVVGDIMKDVLLEAKNHVGPRPLSHNYIYASLHRPYNVDDQSRLSNILATLDWLPYKVVLSLHPRTAKRMQTFGLLPQAYPNILFLEPQSYHSNLSNVHHSHCVITDSGGLQKEAYWLQKKCITVRTETEWPETKKGGCNILVFKDLDQISSLLTLEDLHFDEQLYGDGKAGERMVERLLGLGVRD